MCGRFTLTSDGKDLMDYLGVTNWDSDFTWLPSHNIAPVQKIPVLTCKSERIIQGMYWGLVPNWSKDMKIGSRMINARIETLTEKPAYHNLVQSKRCIVIAAGYYEWMHSNHGKQPYYIHDPKNRILPFAGLWDEWTNDKKQSRLTCTIITTKPSTELRHIHNRMPVILAKDRIDEWIDCSQQNKKALNLLKPYTNILAYHPVSTFVNDYVNNSEKCIQLKIIGE